MTQNRWRRYGKYFLALTVTEIMLQFVPVPDWWEAGIFDDYRYSIRVSRWVESHFGGEYNQLGYRDTEWDTLEDKPRIALLGDSRTFGLLVEEEDTYAAKIEMMSNWETLNLGRPGATPFEALDSMLPDLTPLKPEAATIFLDINSSVTSYVSRTVSGHRNNHLRHLLRSFASWRFLEGAFHIRKERRPVLEVEEHSTLLQKCIDEMKSLGVKKILIIVGHTPLKDFPGLWTQDDYKPYLTASRNIAKENHLTSIELKEVVAPLGDRAFTGTHKIHLSPDGHRLLAREIIDKLTMDTK